MSDAERCVCCGAIIPEGQMVCQNSLIAVKKDKRRIGGRTVGVIMQKIIQVIEALRKWLEWQAAKCWAKEYHPGWVQIATRARGKTTRQIYRDKIMKACRGEYDDG